MGELRVGIFEKALKEVGREAMWISVRGAWQVQVTANARPLSWEHVFCVGGTSREPA